MIVSIANVKSMARTPSSRRRAPRTEGDGPTATAASGAGADTRDHQERPERADKVGSPSPIVLSRSYVMHPDDHADGEQRGRRRGDQCSHDWSADPGPTPVAKKLRDGGKRDRCAATMTITKPTLAATCTAS